MSYQLAYTGSEIDALANKTYNLASTTIYQAEVDTYTMNTTGQDTYIGNKVDADLTLDGEVGSISLDTINRRIAHTGPDKRYAFDAVATVDNPSVVNMVIHFVLAKNGTEFLEKTTSFTRLGTTTDASVLNSTSTITMSDGDYLEVFCKTDKLNGSFNVEHIQLRLFECSRVVCPL